MTEAHPKRDDQTPRKQPTWRLRDDFAYIAPMGAFLALTWVGGTWPNLYAASYVAKTIVAAALLILFRRAYTPIRWNYWWLGLILGVVGIFQWVGMQLWLQQHFEFFRPKGEPFNPFEAFATPLTQWSFITLRLLDAVIVVPFMEELFWRDFLWRSIDAPNDFKLAQVGEHNWISFVGVTLAFATVHGNWCLTAIVWAAMIGSLLWYTRSLGACIVMHAVTNLLLGLYVLRTHDWSFW